MLKINELDEKVLKYWEKNKIFEKSIEQRKDEKPYSFYDGPPFATGLPHYGHILATTIKDTVLRYWTMKGYKVERRVGWDCHGLPVENLIEKELQLKSKKDIEALGIEKFNKACRKSVFSCVDEFSKTLQKVGRWADYERAYTTMDNNYIESVWWVFKQLWDKELVYHDYRVGPFCPRCGTTLSNFEVNQGYREVEDPSIYIKFALKEKDHPNTYFLVWTTTPWTLPGNVALAVGEKVEYVKIKKGEEYWILAKDRLEVVEGDFTIEEKYKGKDLLKWQYYPLYNFIALEDPAYYIIEGDFVSTSDGTGIVHIAPAFGIDDMEVGKANKLPVIMTIEEDGTFKKEIKPWAGKFVKSADHLIVADLKSAGHLYRQEVIKHSYPFCWRCETPLLYLAQKTHYIAVTKIKKDLVKNNKQIHWVPEHLKEGRFGKWLADAKDWAFCRKRYWGAPIPIWRCGKCEKERCIGSVEELKKSSDQQYSYSDLHRPYIDDIWLQCECGGRMTRIEEVFDCWFESGSMPYAQWHYPFENKEKVEETFPADFIAEGLDQTRGWFYTLHVIASALTLCFKDRCPDIALKENSPAFKNVVVNGLVLAEDGKKLSKRLKNYPMPEEVLEKFGADALRYFLLASTPIGEDYRFSEKAVEETYKRVISTLYNTSVFLNTYLDKDFKAPLKSSIIQAFEKGSENSLDKWILSRLQNLIEEVTKQMDAYELTKAARLFDKFIDDLSNWYVRRSRRRFQKPKSPKEKEDASKTLFMIIWQLVQLFAPFAPFITEDIYLELSKFADTKLESVHLCKTPEVEKKFIDKKLEEKMIKVREIVSSALQQRNEEKIKIRQPLATLTIKTDFQNQDLVHLIQEEVNVKNVIVDKKAKKEVSLDFHLTEALQAEGIAREFIRQVQQLRKFGGFVRSDNIVVLYNTDNKELKKIIEQQKNFIKQETLASGIKEQDFKVEKPAKINGTQISIKINKI